MKSKLLLLALCLLGGFGVANAQFVDQKPINELDADYIRIWSDSGPLLSSKITVRVDYGQGGRMPQITDDRRRAMSFNGMIAVLNMFSKEGFELVDIVRDSKDETEIFYLKRKEGFIPFRESMEGTGALSSYDLGGRNLSSGGLVSPNNTGNDYGIVIVNITVDPSGNVIHAEIGRGTNTPSTLLRSESLSAARNTKFNAINSSNNQQGTITYAYNLN